MSGKVYQLRFKGHLPMLWSDVFDDLTLQCEPDGSTTLTGPIPDQAALHGLLLRIRDLGLELLSVNQLSPISNREKEE